MELIKKVPQLVMELQSLENLPEISLPTGFSVATLQKGFESSWESIIEATFKKNLSFQKEIAENKIFTPDRVLFACCGNIPVGTATAWYKDTFPADTGYLHMVGVLPEYSGKALGLNISLAALHMLKRHGYSKAVLQTDDFRLAAIKSYLRLGFKPVYNCENAEERWSEIYNLLNQRK